MALLRANLLDTLSEVDDLGVIDEARRNFSLLESDPTALSADLRHDPGDRRAARGRDYLIDCMKWPARRTRNSSDWSYTDCSAPRVTRRLRSGRSSLRSGEPPQTLVFPMLFATSLVRPSLATEFTIAHWDRLGPMINLVVGPRAVARLGANGTDPALIEALDRFANEHMPAGAARREFTKADGLIRWREKCAVNACRNWIDGSMRTRPPPRRRWVLVCQHRYELFDQSGQRRRHGRVEARRIRLRHVGALRDLELHGVHATRRIAVVAGDVAALEPSVHHVREASLRFELTDHACDAVGAGTAPAEGAKVEFGQLAVEEARFARADRVRIPDDAVAVPGQDAVACAGQGLMVGPPGTVARASSVSPAARPRPG